MPTQTDEALSLRHPGRRGSCGTGERSAPANRTRSRRAYVLGVIVMSTLIQPPLEDTMKVLLISGVCLVSLIQLPARPSAQERPPIIDMHLHADLPPHEIAAGAPALCRPEPCQGEGKATDSHERLGLSPSLYASSRPDSRGINESSRSNTHHADGDRLLGLESPSHGS